MTLIVSDIILLEIVVNLNSLSVSPFPLKLVLIFFKIYSIEVLYVREVSGIQ